jgi:CheY-like chemotaxis protein
MALFLTAFKRLDYMKKKAVVITDDDSGDRFLIRMAFEEAGLDLDISEYQNGSELINFLDNGCKSNPPCLILLDLNMPKKSGFDVLEFIKAHPATCHVPIIVFTTSTDEHDKARCKQLGAIDFISKPGDYTGYVEVAKVIQTHMQRC